MHLQICNGSSKINKIPVMLPLVFDELEPVLLCPIAFQDALSQFSLVFLSACFGATMGQVQSPGQKLSS